MTALDRKVAALWPAMWQHFLRASEAQRLGEGSAKALPHLRQAARLIAAVTDPPARRTRRARRTS